MTIPVRNSRRVISGGGGPFTTLTHEFMLENTTHLEVWADDFKLTLGADYSVSGVGDPNGYTVTILDPGYWSPARWVLSVQYPVNQPSDVDQGGQFGQRFEQALDRLGLGMQSMRDLIRRAPKMPIDTAVDLEVRIDDPVPFQRLGWDETGTVIKSYPPLPAQIGIGEAIGFDTNAELAAYPVAGRPNGFYAVVRRSRNDRQSGGGLWQLTDTPILPVNGVTVIAAADGRYWQKFHGNLDADPSGTTSHPQSVACFEIRVPTDMPTIQSALDYLQNFDISRGCMVDIYLESGFVMQEQVWCFAVNLGWVTIFAADAEVSIDTTYLTRNRTQDIYGMISRAAFTIAQGAIGPRIGCIFDMGAPVGETALRRYGLVVTGPGSAINVMNFRGFKRSGSVGIYANRGGYINCYGADVSGAGTFGILCNRARINCHNVEASNCGIAGVAALYMSHVSAFGAVADNCGKYGVYANFSSTIELNGGFEDPDEPPDPIGGGHADDCGEFGIRAANSSIINAYNYRCDRAGLRGVWLDNASIVNFRQSSACDAGEYGAYAAAGATLNAEQANFSGAGIVCAWIAQGARANLHNANCQKGVSPSATDDIRLINGATVNATGATGGANVANNTPGPAGILYRA